MGRKGEKRRTRRLALFPWLLTALLGISCDADCGGPSGTAGSDTNRNAESDVDTAKDGERTALDRKVAGKVVDFYGALAAGVYGDAYERAHRLAGVVREFRKAPSPDGLDAARQAWWAARDPCVQTHMFTVSDDAKLSVRGEAREYPENLLPKALELEFGPDAGSKSIRGDEAAPVNTELAFPYWPLHGLGAMELLLWGPGSVDGSARLHSDFEVGGGTSKSTMRRRRTLLQAASKLLLEKLAAARSEWRSDGALRDRWAEKGPKAGLAAILERLRETASRLAERQLRTALEEETSPRVGSPYAGRSADALVTAAKGIRNVYEGTYTRTDNSTLDGPGLGKVVAAADERLHRRTVEKLEAALEALRSLSEPFQNARKSESGRAAVREAAQRLEAVEDVLEVVAERLAVEDR